MIIQKYFYKQINMKKIIILLLGLVSLPVLSQKMELGEVTIEELKEKKHSKDSSAVAAVLFEKGKTFFEYKQGEGFSVVTEVETKIKIYKKEGYDWADKEISFYVGGQKDQSVLVSKAFTYNLVDGKIEKTKLKSEGEFIEESNKYWNVKKVQMPNVKEGSIIEYKYVLRSPYMSTLPEWNFQKEIPVNFSEFKVYIPEYYTYNVYKKGSFPISEVKNKINKNVDFVNKELGVQKYSKTNVNINYQEHQTIYKAENIPALSDESYVNNIGNYTASVQHELQSTQFPDSRFELYATDWENVVQKIYESDDFGPQLNKTGYFEDDLKALLTGIIDKNEKINLIYEYVKSRMNWDNFRSYSCDKGVASAYKNKVGNSADINLMLVAMLRYAGIETNPVILSTRSNGIALYPSRTAFNYVIAGIENQDNILLLDATSKYALPNILPIRDLNWNGRIIRKDGSSAQIDLSSQFLSRENVNIMASLSATGDMSGMMKKQNFDYNAFIFRENDAKLSEESYLEKLEKELKHSQIEGYKIENKLELSKPTIETFSFKNNNLTEVIGDKIYFQPLLFLSKEENPFKQEKREYPIDFIYPNQEKFLSIVTIPDGYIVESMPSPVSIVFSEELLIYKYNIVKNGNQIQVSSVFDINTSVLSAKDYDELKTFFSEIIKKQTEKIVLKKA